MRNIFRCVSDRALLLAYQTCGLRGYDGDCCAGHVNEVVAGGARPNVTVAGMSIGGRWRMRAATAILWHRDPDRFLYSWIEAKSMHGCVILRLNLIGMTAPYDCMHWLTCTYRGYALGPGHAVLAVAQKHGGLNELGVCQRCQRHCECQVATTFPYNATCVLACATYGEHLRYSSPYVGSTQTHLTLSRVSSVPRRWKKWSIST